MDSSYTAIADLNSEEEKQRWKIEENSSLEEGGTAVLNEKAETLGGDTTRDVVVSELKIQFGLAWPIIIANSLSYSYVIVTTMFLGHLGELELSSASIAGSFVNVTGFSVMIGISTAMETLCGQANGAKKYDLMGIYFQSSLVVGLTCCLPIATLWFNIERVLLAVGQDPQVSALAGTYARCITPGVFSAVFDQALFRLLQAQGIVFPQMIISLVVACLHPLVCYLFIFTFGLGFRGGPFAAQFSYWSLFLTLACYVAFFTEIPGRCWQRGLAIPETLGTVGAYTKLAVPSVVMVCLETWSFELIVLLSGLLPKPTLELSLLSICLQTTTLCYTIPLGLGLAASTRVANELGARRPNAAKLAVKVVLGLAICEASVVSAALLLNRNDLGHAFTNVKEVQHYVAELIPLLALSTFMDSIHGVLSGVARGSGGQYAGAAINIVAFYLVGIPLALLLGFHFHLDAKGLVIGYCCGIFTHMTGLILYVHHADWEKTVAKAQERLRRDELNAQERLRRDALREPLLK